MELRKRAPAARLVDEPGDEVRDIGGTDSASSRVTYEEDCDYDLRVSEEEEEGEEEDDDDDDDEYRVKSASEKKRTSSKSKKPVADKGKTARKRKRENETAEQTTQERSKKFSHSNRRNRRRGNFNVDSLVFSYKLLICLQIISSFTERNKDFCVGRKLYLLSVICSFMVPFILSVDDDLLKTPEDEIDFQRLPIRDIILLAEHKERLAAKEATTSNSTNQRTGNTFDEDGSYNEDQDGEFTEEQTYRQPPSLILFNHQSFMDKAPTARWSKEDTELFYECVRQFGTDLSMIQQLFPGRTRHEIKLKFKKEGRQHPLRFSEAQTHRCTDYSFFKKLIEKLQEPKQDGSNSSPNSEAAAANSESKEEVAKSGLDEDVATEDQEEEVAKSNLDEDAATEDQEVYATEVQNTSQSDEIDDDDDDDDDDDIWNSYKSEL